jgi:hypothetical protein
VTEKFLFMPSKKRFAFGPTRQARKPFRSQEI